MNSEFDNHLDKCRCCLRAIKSARKRTEITEEIRKMFFEIVQVELTSSDLYSSIICDVCKTKLDDATETRKNFSENQRRLYNFVAESHVIKSEPVETDAIELPEDLERSGPGPDPFAIPKLPSEEIVVKVEAMDLDEIFVQPKKSKPKSIRPKPPPKPVLSSTGKPSKHGCKLCQFCGKTLSFINYNKHAQLHLNKLNNVYFHCDLCTYKSNSKYNLGQHMFMHQSDASKPIFDCDFCPKVFYRKTSLQIHQRQMHTKQERATCDICHKTFKNQMCLRVHRSTLHEGVSFPCDKCDRTFGSFVGRQGHYDTHHAPKSPCTICGQMVGPRSALQVHMQSSHTAKLKCPIEGCGKLLYDKKVLNRHIESIHGPPMNVKCPSCDIKFKNMYSMKRHVKLQHNTERRPCPIAGCTVATPRRDNLIKHLRRHREIPEEERERLVQELKVKF